MRLSYLACVCVASTACSVIGVHHPDHLPKDGRPVDCESELPGLDRTVAAGSVGMVIAGAVTGAVETSSQAAALIATGAIVAAVYGASAYYGSQAGETCRRMVAAGPELQAHARAEVAPSRERAWQLTQAAKSAAVTGDCTTVLRIDTQVADLDQDLHDTVFLRDAAILRCLTGTQAQQR